MKLTALMPVRNESWCLGLSLRVALMWCDSVCLLLHECSDGSADIVSDVIRENDRGRVIVTRESGEWDEMRHRQALLEMARRNGATHIAITDADEVLTGNCFIHPSQNLLNATDWKLHHELFENLNGGAILQVPGYNLRNGITKYHTNGIWSDRLFSLAFRDEPRLSWSGDTFHSREPRGIGLVPYRPITQGHGGVLHLWGSSERRLRAKSAHYKMVERIRWPNKHAALIDRMYSWSVLDRPEVYNVTPDKWTFAAVPAEWWEPYRHLMKHLDIDAEPWQIAEVRRLLKVHGRERFSGLDLFGVDNE